jgi:hypothetical protein
MNKNIILFLKYKNEIKDMNKSKKDYLYYQNLNNSYIFCHLSNWKINESVEKNVKLIILKKIKNICIFLLLII